MWAGHRETTRKRTVPQGFGGLRQLFLPLGLKGPKTGNVVGT